MFKLSIVRTIAQVYLHQKEGVSNLMPKAIDLNPNNQNAPNKAKAQRECYADQ